MQYTYTVDQSQNGISLGAFLKRAGLSLSLVRTLKRAENGITVNGELAHTNRVLSAGDVVAVCPPESECALSPCYTAVDVLYESRDAIVYNKPAGMAVHPTLGYPDGTLANVYAARLLERNENGAFRPVNRLDKNTSGTVLAAKSRLAAPGLAQSSKKLYIALAEGEIDLPDRFEINAPIALGENSIIVRRVHASGKPSVTRFAVLARLRGYTLLAAQTVTGRTHQIRAHLQYIGHPLCGDDLYGGSCDMISRHALHCARVSFFDESRCETVSVTAPLPRDFLCALERVGCDAAAASLPPTLTEIAEISAVVNFKSKLHSSKNVEPTVENEMNSV